MARGQVWEMEKSRIMLGLAAVGVLVLCLFPKQTVYAGEEPIVLRVCSWEEYIDLVSGMQRKRLYLIMVK